MGYIDKIQILITGGTFDKEYNYLNGELYFKNTHLDQMIDRGRCTLPLNIKTLMMIDSLEMTTEDRMVILESIVSSNRNHFVITHGTDTMAETAAFLMAQYKGNLENKTVVLMGAMIPYSFGSSSDGFFNLGAALAFCQAMPHGVYIAMNGRIFDWNNVRKNKQTGYFEDLNSGF